MLTITAAEARALAGPTVQERVEFIMPMIESAAKDKKRSISLHDDFWVNEGYRGTADYKEAVKKLEDLGYTVRFFYEERQFVDMYTVVAW